VTTMIQQRTAGSFQRFGQAPAFAALILGSALLGCAATPDESEALSGKGVDLRPAAGMVDTTPFECPAEGDAGGFTFDKIPVWRDDAKAAYTMIHDDMCGRELRGIDRMAVPALALRGLTAGVGPFVDACATDGLWGMVRAVEAKGNEIVNHSWTHPNITALNAYKEVILAKREFDLQMLKPVTFYIFPYDFFTDETVSMVEAAGHIGARAGMRDMTDGFMNPPLNPPEPTNDMRLLFDVWPRTYSKYAAYPEKAILNLHVFNAIEKGGFGVREFHSVSPDDKPPLAGQGFGPVPLKVYEDHLDFLYLAWKSNLVWTSNPSTIIRYRHARTTCKASVAGNAISYDVSNPECQKFATPISVLVKTGNDVPGLKATQAGQTVFTRKLGPNLFSVTADPTLGNVELGGCSMPGPIIDPTTPMPPKPTPAQSVCDLDQVKGVGFPGRMDDLERSNEELQLLPNPSGGDGRDGSWSWYPGNASVKIVQDGRRNNVLRYAGGNHGRWSGTTLAFIGGNGAGTCYDGSAYKGIRFRIKGFVQTGDIYQNKTVLSIVTAETQTRKLGGDLVGEGGHFHAVYPVTPEWQTIEVLWGDLERPTHGATAGIARFAVDKMQAVDWGVANSATNYEVFLDDIELF
jgi:hypothetical protein